MTQGSWFSSLVLACCVLVVACRAEAPSASNDAAGPRTVGETRALIREQLAVGAQTGEIEAFFARHGIRGGWNRFEEKYDAIVDVDQFNGVRIELFVDDERRFLRAEVYPVNTVP